MLFWVPLAAASVDDVTPQEPEAIASPQPDPEELQLQLLSEAPKVPEFPIKDAARLSWEVHRHPARKHWTEYAEAVINQYLDEFEQAQDLRKFCWKYNQLSREDRVQAIAQIISGTTGWESGSDPLDRTIEGPDLDVITGLPPVSEGLLQLSYQDMVNYTDLNTDEPYCPFTWDTDRNLPTNDPHRSILNPYVNLYCGIRIMADSIVTNVDPKGHRKVVYNGYWSTLGNGFHLRNRAFEIEQSVQALPFCGGHRDVIAIPAEIVLKGVNDVQKFIKHRKYGQVSEQKKLDLE
jgi:hypothetical protein